MVDPGVIYIFWTCPNLEEGKKIARALLANKLIACASLIPHVESLYLWNEAIEEGKEVKAILKTRRSQFEKIKIYIQEHTSYQVPEIVEIPLERIHTPYREWIMKETGGFF